MNAKWIALVTLCATLTTPVYAAKSAHADTININQATALQIAKQIKGIGPKRAQAIVRYRQEHGQYHKLSDLVLVHGISTKSLSAYQQAWKKKITFK